MTIPSATTMQEGRRQMAERCYKCVLENTPDTVKVIYIRTALSGRAKYRTGELHAPRPKTRKALYIFLHESAHFALHINSKKPVHVKEMEAEQWAHEKMRAYGIPVPRVMTVRAKEYVERKIRKAERRGAKHIDAAARKFSERKLPLPEMPHGRGRPAPARENNSTSGLCPNSSICTKNSFNMQREAPIRACPEGQPSQDAITSGQKKALIVLGHVVSEQAGMKYCAEWLKGFIKEVPVEFVAAAEPFWRPDKPTG